MRTPRPWPVKRRNKNKNGLNIRLKQLYLRYEKNALQQTSKQTVALRSTTAAMLPLSSRFPLRHGRSLCLLAIVTITALGKGRCHQPHHGVAVTEDHFNTSLLTAPSRPRLSKGDKRLMANKRQRSPFLKEGGGDSSGKYVHL